MRLPVWLLLAVAGLVIIFGAYRIRLAFRSDDEDQRARNRKGMYGMPRRTHLLIGVVYLLLGGALIATSYGWRPLGNLLGGDSAGPASKSPTVMPPPPGTPPSSGVGAAPTPK